MNTVNYGADYITSETKTEALFAIFLTIPECYVSGRKLTRARSTVSGRNGDDLTANGANMIEHIDHNDCITIQKDSNIWECFAYKQHLPCAYRTYIGEESYCIHKDNLAFSIWAISAKNNEYDFDTNENTFSDTTLIETYST